MSRAGKRVGDGKGGRGSAGRTRAVRPATAKPRIDREPSSDSGVRLSASVLIAEVRGFTALAVPLLAVRVVDLLGELFTTMTDVAVAHRAVIDSLVGDAMMLLFGPPQPRKDDAARALRAALEMQRVFLAVRNRWLRAGLAGADEIGLAIGIASGDLVVANLGATGATRRTAVGEAVNCAARLAALAQRGDILLDSVTYERRGARLDSEVAFTSRDLHGDSRERIAAYRCQHRRAGLRVVGPRLHTDPVCHQPVMPDKLLRRMWRGDPYYFCSRDCMERFDTEPKNFIG